MNLDNLNLSAPRWLPSLKALRALDAVGRHGSFQLAAEELGVSPAAVHQLVRNLEEVLDKKLVVRDGRSIEMTEAAQSGLADLRTSFQYMAEAVHKIRQQGRRRQLRISVEPSFAHAWLVGRLSRFQNENADIDVLIDSSTRVVDLSGGEADVAIRYASAIDSGLQSEVLFEDETIAVCSPALMGGQKYPLSPGVLESAVLLHFDWPYSPQIQAGWQRWMQEVGWPDARLAGGLRFTDYNAAIQSAIAGQGFALASRPLVSDALTAGVLVEPLDRAYKNGYKYYAVTDASKDMDGLAETFVGWIHRESRKANPHF